MDEIYTCVLNISFSKQTFQLPKIRSTPLSSTLAQTSKESVTLPDESSIHSPYEKENRTRKDDIIDLWKAIDELPNPLENEDDPMKLQLNIMRHLNLKYQAIVADKFSVIFHTHKYYLDAMRR